MERIGKLENVLTTLRGDLAKIQKGSAVPAAKMLGVKAAAWKAGPDVVSAILRQLRRANGIPTTT